jgi:hypothetical protein
MNQSRQTKSNLRQLAAANITGPRRVADRTAGSIDRLAAERTRLIAEALIDQLAKASDGNACDPKHSDRITNLRDSSKLFEPQPEHELEDSTPVPVPYCKTHVDLDAMKLDSLPGNTLSNPAASEAVPVRETFAPKPAAKLKEDRKSNNRLPNNFAGMMEWFRGLAQPIRAD